MEHYNLWQDFFDTYQSLSDATKALWLIVPAAFVLGLVALILRTRVALRKWRRRSAATSFMPSTVTPTMCFTSPCTGPR